MSLVRLFAHCFWGRAVGKLKSGFAFVIDHIGINWMCHRLQMFYYAPMVRAIHYHGISGAQVEIFEAHLRFYAQHYRSIDAQDFMNFQNGVWNNDRPGLILSFDDGLKSHAEIVAPLLEKYGFTGWFFLPVGFIDTPPAEQITFAKRHRIDYIYEVHEQQIAMSWDDIRRLAEHHEIGCHTHTHYRFSESTPKDRLKQEIWEPKARLEEELERKVSAFCWVGGEEASYCEAAACEISKAGYSLGFMTNSAVIRPFTHPLQLQRTNVESDDSAWLMRFQLSGLMDLIYSGKRRRVNRRTAVEYER